MTKIIAVAVAACLAAATARAQSSVYDPAQLPAFHGRVTQYSLTVRDDLDGLILDDGTEVHIQPRLSTELAFAVKPGEKVTVHGMKASGVALVEAVSITNDATGTVVTGNLTTAPFAPNYAPPFPRTAMEAKGRVKMPLHSAAGELNGVLLEDGTIIRLLPGSSAVSADCLAPGHDVSAQGIALSSPLGRVLETSIITLDASRIGTGSGPQPRRTTIIFNGAGGVSNGHVPLLNPPTSASTPEPASAH